MSDPQLEILGEESLLGQPSDAMPANSDVSDRSLPAGKSALHWRPDPLFHVVLLLVCAGVVSLSVVLSVRDRTQVLLPVLSTPLPELCLAKRMSGVGCPGCGMTRCFISLGHGDLAAAWSYNPAGVWFFAVVLFQVPYRALQLWRIRRGLPELRTGWLAQVSLGILAVGMVSQWLLKLCGLDF
jgi:hypothetical protein